MKIMLIALNIFLVAAVAHLAWTYSSEPLEFASTSKKFSPSKLERKKAAAHRRGGIFQERKGAEKPPQERLWQRKLSFKAEADCMGT